MADPCAIVIMGVSGRMGRMLVETVRDSGKARLAGAVERPQVLQILAAVNARAVDLGPDSLVAETTGSQEEIERLVSVLEPFGILEMVQTGLVSMTRAAEKPRLFRGHAA